LVGCARSTGAASAGTDDKPGRVALEYVRALFSGDFDKAQSLVEPGSQPAFRLVALGVDPKLVTARDLAIGATVVNGARASTTILGTICRAGDSSSAGATDCITNHDPGTSNPIFKVALVRQPGGDWLVSLDVAAGLLPSRPAGSTGVPGSAQASVPASHG
jgi:hypothetical protein